jgi:hypothetical protein
MRNGMGFTSPGSVSQLTKYDLLQPQHVNHTSRTSELHNKRWAHEEIWEFIYHAMISFTFDHLSQVRSQPHTLCPR